ncbi:MAG TPA: glycosyltransferase family 2 protein [Solirubrobacteraceae bacterium]|nr:glycosyltransferase family 2 protein [Solirubrobacteraceae bacterium]
MPDGSARLAIVPAYNEEATLPGVLESLRRHAPGFDVLVIDDGSTDRTGELARTGGATLLQLPFNVGIGGAVQSGYLYACEHGYDYVVQVDADGQHDATEIATLQDTMGADPALDVVCGSRFLEKRDYRASFGRRTGIQIFAAIVSLIARKRVTDPTSGFRLCNRRAIELFARDYPHDYPEVEALLTLHYNRLTMREVPVRMFQRGGGVSSIRSGKSAYYMVKVLLAIFMGLARRRPFVEPGDESALRALERA